MEKLNFFKVMSHYCEKANLENIEEIMFDVDKILTEMSEDLYYSLKDEIKKYLNILNPIYIEKMKMIGRIVPFEIETLTYPSSN